MSTPPLTRVLTIDRPHRAIGVLAFGIPFSEDRVTEESSTQTVRLFQPGAIFSMLWWRRLSRRRQHRTLAILEAPRLRVEGDPVPDIHPGAIVHVFMDQYGPPGRERSVDLMLDLIQCLRDHNTEPAHVAPGYWRRASCRILLGQRPPDLADGDYPREEQIA